MGLNKYFVNHTPSDPIINIQAKFCWSGSSRSMPSSRHSLTASWLGLANLQRWSATWRLLWLKLAKIPRALKENGLLSPIPRCHCNTLKKTYVTSIGDRNCYTIEDPKHPKLDPNIGPLLCSCSGMCCCSRNPSRSWKGSFRSVMVWRWNSRAWVRKALKSQPTSRPWVKILGFSYRSTSRIVEHGPGWCYILFGSPF